MSLKRLFLCAVSVTLAIGWAGTVQAATYSLRAGSAAQLHIGGGLALPIQPAATIGVTGQNFPPLLIPKRVGVVTVMGTTGMATNQAITVPAGILSRQGIQKTVGVFTSNPTLYAVATNLDYTWPTAPAVFSAAGRTGAATVVFPGAAAGNSIRYSNRFLGKRFGGPGRFAISPGVPGGGLNPGPVTVYAIAIPTAGAGFPPCVHTALTPVPFPVPGNPACVGALVAAFPTGKAAIGAAVGVTATTPGGPHIAPNVGIGAFGPGLLKPLGPPGTVSFFMLIPMTASVSNAASSDGFPWTTAMLTISAMSAMGGAEKFIISGDDNRTALGAGTLQMVSGALSTRPLSGTNANRGWVKLILADPNAVPALSDPLRLGMIGLLTLIGAGYAMRKRFSGTASA